MKQLTKLIEDGLNKKNFSALSVEVIHKGQIVLSTCNGLESLPSKDMPTPKKISQKHLFDLASLTKSLCTSFLCSILIEKGLIEKNTNVCDLYSDYAISINPSLKDITVANLLTHSSGLEAWFPIYKTAHSRSDAYLFVRSRTVNYKTGEKNIYSDLGYMMLGELVEILFEKRLDYLFEHYVTQPLELRDLDFMPKGQEDSRKDLDFVSTGYSNIRNRELIGEVNDENAFVFDGIAGHAGLFGTVNDTSRLALHILNIIKGREENDNVSQKTLIDMIEIQNNSDWTFGWHYPSTKNSSAGTLMSKNSIGMTGFTGTSIWMDLDNDVVITLLSNRSISPEASSFGGEKDSFSNLRPLIHDAIMGELL